MEPISHHLVNGIPIHQLIENMDVQTFISFTSTNREYRSLYSDDRVWKYFLWRDYRATIGEGGTAFELYELMIKFGGFILLEANSKMWQYESVVIHFFDSTGPMFTFTNCTLQKDIIMGFLRNQVYQAGTSIPQINSTWGGIIFERSDGTELNRTPSQV